MSAEENIKTSLNKTKGITLQRLARFKDKCDTIYVKTPISSFIPIGVCTGVGRTLILGGYTYSIRITISNFKLFDGCHFFIYWSNTTDFDNADVVRDTLISGRRNITVNGTSVRLSNSTISQGKLVLYKYTETPNILNATSVTLDSKDSSFSNLASGASQTKILALNDTTNIGGWSSKITLGASGAAGSLTVYGPIEVVNNSLTVGTKVTAKEFNAESDIRKKDLVSTLDLSNNYLSNLPIYNYKFKGSDEEQIGIVAQDLQGMYPKLVVEDEEGYLSIKESKLIYLLMAEVKELRERIEVLEKQ